MKNRRALTTQEIEAGYTVTKEVARVAFARNGNVHNPTRTFRWLVHCKGKLVGFCSTLAGALELVEMSVGNGQRTPPQA